MNLQELKRRQEQEPENIEVAAEILRARMRSGELPEQNVIWASRLGHQTSRSLFPNEEASTLYTIVKQLESREECIKLALWVAKKVLHIWEEEFSESSHIFRSRHVINGIEIYLADCTEINRVMLLQAAERSYMAIVHSDIEENSPSLCAGRSIVYAGEVAGNRFHYPGYNMTSMSVASAADALGNTSSEELLAQYLLK